MLILVLVFLSLQMSSFNIGSWNFDIDIYMWISQNGIFYFFQFFISFSELFPFFIFYYFLYFKAVSQPIMKTNRPNWSLGLGEYIVDHDIEFT